MGEAAEMLINGIVDSDGEYIHESDRHYYRSYTTDQRRRERKRRLKYCQKQLKKRGYSYTLEDKGSGLTWIVVGDWKFDPWHGKIKPPNGYEVWFGKQHRGIKMFLQLLEKYSELKNKYDLITIFR